ncbi:MAG: hypothetical protein NVS3B19_09910 [Ginsengibacter sp.]
MKNSLVIPAFLIISLISCKKSVDKPYSRFASSPEAIASFDNVSGGIYKGVLVGSTGNFKIVLQNNEVKILVTNF